MKSYDVFQFTKRAIENRFTFHAWQPGVKTKNSMHIIFDTMLKYDKEEW